MLGKSQKVFLIFVTAPTKKEASQLASLIIKNRLAACVNILYPIESLFWWKKRVAKSKEALLIIKSVKSKFASVKKLISTHHSYKVPEIIGWSMEGANQSYLNWIVNSLACD